MKQAPKVEQENTTAKVHAVVVTENTLPAVDFVKVEKNLTSLGFFTPSSKKIKNAKAKMISFTRVIEGKRVEAKVTIAPAALYGLPITADQDKYIALQKIINDLKQELGEIGNPIRFSTAELLRLLGKRIRTGKNYDDVGEWLKRMTSTAIVSEGAVYYAGRKTWATDTFHVFERSVSFGRELPDGTIADKNYVWLSEWQIENINSNHFLAIDHDMYKRLKNHIAKALVPLLQIWLYASREAKSFEKRYDELCQLLNIRQYLHRSKIEEKLGPGLDELKHYHYITDWEIEQTSDEKAYKVIFYHGDKFHRDLQQRLDRKSKTQLKQLTLDSSATEQKVEQPAVRHPIVSELFKRGVTIEGAKKLIKMLAADQPVLDQLEWGDQLIADRTRSGDGIKNPPGFYVYLIKNNVTVPENFLTSRKRQMHEERWSQVETAQLQRFALEDAYEDYRKREIVSLIEEMGPEQFQRIVSEKKASFLQQFKYAATWEPEMLEKVLVSAARSEVAKRIPFKGFEAFCQEQQNTATQPQDTETLTTREKHFN